MLLERPRFTLFESGIEKSVFVQLEWRDSRNEEPDSIKENEERLCASVRFANESYRRSSDSKIETVSWASFRTFDQKKGIKRRSLSTSLFPSSSSFLLCSTLYKMQLSTTLLAPVLLALSISRSSASPIEKRDGPLKLGQVSFGLLP